MRSRTTQTSAHHTGDGAGPNLLPFYAGGFLGPFGTMVLLPMLPELREAFDASTEALSWAFTIYLLPMAALLLVSGTIGERYGRHRVLQLSLLGFTAAGLMAATAPTLAVFLIGRGIQGACNAFFTPLLLAGISDVTPPAALGRKIGYFSAFQAAGGAVGPLAGGVAADIDWRFAYVATALAAAALAALRPLVASPPPNRAGQLLLKPLLSRRMALLGSAAFFFAFGPYASSVTVGLKARDLLGLSATNAGYLLLVGSAAGSLVGGSWGDLVDRWGPPRVGIISAAASGLALSAAALAGSWPTLTLAWTLAGAIFIGSITALQSQAAVLAPTNRSGALSLAMSFRFAGHALGPLVWVRVFTDHPRAAFFGAASMAIVAAGAFSLLGASDEAA